MDLDPYPLRIPSTPTSFFGCYCCSWRIRVYYVNFPILSGGHHPKTLTKSLQFYGALPYHYTWYVYGEETSIINILDLQAFEETHQYPPSYHDYQPQQQQQQESIDDVAILQDLRSNHERQFPISIWLRGIQWVDQKQILKNLRVTKYRQDGEEESEIWVVCQVEFEKNKKIGVFQCKHRFHPNVSRSGCFGRMFAPSVKIKV